MFLNTKHDNSRNKKNYIDINCSTMRLILDVITSCQPEDIERIFEHLDGLKKNLDELFCGARSLSNTLHEEYRNAKRELTHKIIGGVDGYHLYLVCEKNRGEITQEEWNAIYNKVIEYASKK